jgi:hypothetical protein
MKKSNLPVIFLVLVIIFIAGCTGPVSPAPAVTQTTILPSPSITVPVTPTPIESLSPSATPSATSFKTLSTTHPITTVTTPRLVIEAPFVEYLNFQKRIFIYPIPNCLMQNAFPAVANDNGYGINKVAPKLVAVSQDDYVLFLWKYTEGNAANTPLKTLPECRGSDNEPTWNFVEVRVILNPTNTQPANYTVIRNVWSNNRNIWSDQKLVAQLPTTERLVIDQKATLTSYIPVRTDELDLFDTVSVTTVRL